MEIWLATTVLLALVGLLALLLYLASKYKKRWLNASGIVVGILVLVLAFYLPGVYFVSTLQRLESAASTRLTTSSSPLVTTNSETKNLPRPTTTALPSSTSTRPTVQPSPTAPHLNQPVQHPDVLAVREQPYPPDPLFSDFNEVTQFMLYNFLSDQFEFDFYLAEELAPDEGSGYYLLDKACATALAYYFFSAFYIEDLYTINQADGKVYAKVKLSFTHPERDVLARENAVEFIRNNPVPPQGFSSAAAEKAYARLIHNFIARKVIYAPIGYDPEKLQGLEKYEAFQEAYNVLTAPDNEAVCAGYARAFALLAQYAGINAAYVYGNETGTESHAWNVIYPCDGSEPVLVDVTWDDIESSDFHGQKHVSDKYFYIPLSAEYEHEADIYFTGFLQYMNGH